MIIPGKVFQIPSWRQIIWRPYIIWLGSKGGFYKKINVKEMYEPE